MALNGENQVRSGIIDQVWDILPEKLEDFNDSHLKAFNNLVHLSNDGIPAKQVTPARNPIIP